MVVKDARTFLLAIKEATQFDMEKVDHDAVEWLESMFKRVMQGLDEMGVHGIPRDEWLFFEGMMKGKLLDWRKDAVAGAGRELYDKGFIDVNGKPTGKLPS